ncbi:MAG: D-ribose pyranase [Ramlibacter sp.]|nr:D-ribose pyranase [Cryobacterium sp.]
MKRGGLLNSELNAAIAAMGHGDTLIVCDAGFPIPSDAWRIDLALVRDVPDLGTVLNLIAQEFICERVVCAEEVAEYNPSLLTRLHAIFPDSEFGTMPHVQLLSEAARSAKAIVRTGAFEPWGNIILRSGVDVRAYFEREDVKVPDEYKARAGRS